MIIIIGGEEVNHQTPAPATDSDELTDGGRAREAFKTVWNFTQLLNSGLGREGATWSNMHGRQAKKEGNTGIFSTSCINVITLRLLSHQALLVKRCNTFKGPCAWHICSELCCALSCFAWLSHLHLESHVQSNTIRPIQIRADIGS